jgi:hypothetical protein
MLLILSIILHIEVNNFIKQDHDYIACHEQVQLRSYCSSLKTL